MEHLSTVLGRTLVTAAQSAEDGAEVLPIRRTRTLFDLIERFEEQEEQHNPDAVLPTSKLRATPEGLIDVPGAGACALTDWSQKQMASLLGFRPDRWFENASPLERADELNRRLARASGDIRVRSTRAVEAGVEADGTLRAVVSTGYSPVEDSQVGRLVVAAMRHVDGEMKLIRIDVTDRSSTFVVAIGKPYKVGGDGQVGDLWGGLMVRNSGVGYASLLMVAHLVRLVCRNGMTCPLPDSVLLRRRHRALDDSKLRWQLSDRLEQLPGLLRQAGTVLQASTEKPLTDVEAAVRRVLQQAGLPLRMLPPIMEAYAREPAPTAFGVSQALTLAAQRFPAEERLELEQAAGQYLRVQP